MLHVIFTCCASGKVARSEAYLRGIEGFALVGTAQG